MKRSVLTFSLGAAVAVAALAACSSDSTTSSSGTPTNAEITENSRQTAGDGAAATVDQLGASEAAAGASAAVGANVVGATTVNCTGPDGDNWYTCAATTENGLTVVRQIRFWAGTSPDLWWNDPDPTDSVNTRWTADGTFSGQMDASRSLTVADSAHATMRVLFPPAGGSAVVSGALHVWDGAGAAHHTASWTGQNGVERILTQIGTDTVNAVTFQMPRSANPYPLSGSIVMDFTGNITAGDFSRTVTRHIVVTFDGTHIAQLEDGGITCDLDLDPPHAVTNCR